MNREQMSSLDAKIKKRADGTLHVTLRGTMDEESDFEELFAQLDADATLDLSGIERLNSIGVHRWIGAISTVTAKHSIRVEACAYVVALQANSVANLFGSAVVASTLAPYYCQSCNENQMVVVTAEELSAEEAPSPRKRCPDCKVEMAFDELDSYFDFLKGRPS